MITVLTPTYNRAHTLKNAYESLKKQTCKDFKWLIIDDGSTDNTKEIISSFIKEKKIDITYFKKENGGKHTALNYGIKKIKSDYLIILDSDDILLENAIEEIKKIWKKYKNDEKICCISFLKVFPNKQTIGKKYEGNEIISNHIDFRYNQSLLGDMCEVFRTNVLKKHPFPIFEKERFLSEALIWNQIGMKYNTVYMNIPIYEADYYGDGLSKNFFKLVYNNPLGALHNSNMFLNKRFKLSIRIKNAILYTGYKLRSKEKYKEINIKSNSKLLTTLLSPAGLIFYFYLKSKKN